MRLNSILCSAVNSQLLHQIDGLIISIIVCPIQYIAVSAGFSSLIVYDVMSRGLTNCSTVQPAASRPTEANIRTGMMENNSSK